VKLYKLSSAIQIAEFLLKHNDVHKDRIGEYLGGHEPVQQEVLSAFTEALSFARLNLEQALRFYLSKFTLPGESQQVDRVMQIFSAKFAKDNPESLSAAVAYTLGYLLIVLQTDLHNPQVQRKILPAEFIKIVRDN